MIARHKVLLFVSELVLAPWLLGATHIHAQTSLRQAWVTAREVLVLYNTRGPDENGNFRSDSQDVAEYYAARRGIPTDQLLALAVTERQGKPDVITYPDFLLRVLVPTVSDWPSWPKRGIHIHYIVTCYGMPLVVNTYLAGKQGGGPIQQPTDLDVPARALTGWLVNIEENFEAGFDRATGRPGRRGGARAAPESSPLGTTLGDITLPWIRGPFDRPEQGSTFKTLRLARPPSAGRPISSRIWAARLSRSAWALSKRRSTPSATCRTSPADPHIRTTGACGSTTTAGQVNEPFSAGVPFMASAFAALTSGHDMAEAFYSAIPLNTRWNTVVFGDPLYAPFRNRAKRPDETPPAIQRFSLQALRALGGGHRVVVNAELAAATLEQADDVALWQVEYGLTPEYGSVVPYIEWPDPGDDKVSSRRRYFYTRRFAYELADLLPDREYHVRVSARDLFGNVRTVTGTVKTLR